MHGADSGCRDVECGLKMMARPACDAGAIGQSTLEGRLRGKWASRRALNERVPGICIDTDQFQLS